MSDLTLCCHCVLEGIKSRPKKSGRRVAVLPAKDEWPDGSSFPTGSDILVYPKEINRKDAVANRSQYKVAWMAEITDGCAC